MNELAPRWYLRAATPVGTRYFYPRPKDQAPYHPQGHRWSDAAGQPLEARGTALVSEFPITEAVEHWHERATITGWALKPAADIPEHLRPLALSDQYPARLTPEEFNERADSDDETMSLLLRDLYERVMSEPGEATHWHDMSELVEMPGDPDPAPDLEWQLDQPLTAGFYGPLVAHLFPGQLVVPFDRVAETIRVALDELGLPGNALDGKSLYAFRNDRKISSAVSIPWDEPVPYDTVPGRSRRAREANARQARASRMAMSWSAEVQVPRFIRASTKAAAVGALERVVEEYRSVLLPPHTVACSHCHGRGYVS